MAGLKGHRMKEEPILFPVLLSKYDILYVFQKTIKGSVIVEFLVDRAVEDYELIKFDFQDEDLIVMLQVEKEPIEKDYWKLYFDGPSYAMGHDISAILISPKGEYCPFSARLDLDFTNNVVK